MPWRQWGHDDAEQPDRTIPDGNVQWLCYYFGTVLRSEGYGQIAPILGNSLVLGLLAAVVLTIWRTCILQPILRFLNVPENLLHTATQYVSVIIAGLVVTLLYDVLSATLRAIGDTVTPLIVLAVSVVLNIGGDLLLIVVLHMGVLGAAVATVLSQLIAVVVCAVYLWKSMKFCGYVWMI